MITESFLQSAAWEKFQQSIGRRTWRADGNLVIQHDLPRGFNYLYSPRPESVTSSWLSGVEEIAKKEKAIFLKIDPTSHFPPLTSYLKSMNSIQPQKTVILDLQKSEQELLAGMHEKTRYNIRLAERKGVSSIKYPRTKANMVRGRQELSIKDEKIETFWNLLQETAKRDRFKTHPREHYEKLFTIRDNDFSNELFFARYNNKIMAAVMINFYKSSQTATYLHGASSGEHREVMAPHLLHWSVIKEAKARGFKYYDFGGIDEKRWPGLTRFKLGFGEERIEYPPSVDIIYRPALYRVYRLVRSLRQSI